MCPPFKSSQPRTRLSGWLIVVVGLLVVVSRAARSQDLNFIATAPVYPAGALSHSYTAIGQPAVDVSINISGSGQFSLNSPYPSNGGLTIAALNFATSSETRTFTFDFAVPVVGLYFNINSFNQNLDDPVVSRRSQDQVTFNAIDYAGQPASANIAAGAGYTISGNTVTAASETATSFLVSYSYGVKTLTIVYGCGPQSPAEPGVQGFTIGDLYWNALPVTLSTLTARQLAQGIELSWETDSWERIVGHHVLRSTDLNHFDTIGYVDIAKETSSGAKWSWIDPSPPAETVYYRLQHTFMNGRNAYSKIIAVTLTDPPDESVVYPNPSDGRLIHIRGRTAELLKLTDPNGRDIAVSTTSTDTETQIRPIDPLAPGLYILSWRQNSGERLVWKLIVR